MGEKVVSKSKRILGLDIIRVIAIMFVFVTHAITYRSVLDYNQLSFKWTIYMVIRFTAMSCVPLFLLLTGYLNNKTKPSKEYYKGIIPLLISYIVISIAEIIANAYYTHTPIDFKSSLISILNYTANGYAWYFEMYIGLFLVIPFLNILYNNIENKKDKIILISALTFLTLIPQIVKSFKVNDTWLNITPDYWQIAYPLTYFFIGKFIKEFQPKFSILKRIAFVICAILIPCTFCYCFSTKTEYAWYIFNGFEALTNAITAVAIFLLFYDFDKNIPVFGKVITQISICSFEMYLFSSMVDKYIYSACDYNIFITVPCVALITFVLSKILILIINLFNRKK